MLSLFWGIGPAFVMYLLVRDWWDYGHRPIDDEMEGDDGDD